MKETGIKLKVFISMEERTRGGSPRLQNGTGITVSIMGRNYPATTIDVDDILMPGEIGNATIDIIFLSGIRPEITVGSVLNILDGPDIKIATATVLDFCDDP